MNVVLVDVLAYIVLQVVLGLLVSRGIRTEDDYLLAGRRVGFGLATFSFFATWFGAETCIGSAGAVYERGLAGFRQTRSGTVRACFQWGRCLQCRCGGAA